MIGKKDFIVGFLCGVLVTVGAGELLFGRTGNDDGTKDTIHSISRNQHAANNEIRNALSANRDAQSTLGAVGERINRSEDLARGNAEKIDDIRRQLEECRKLAETSGSILNDIGKENRSGQGH